MCNGHKPITIEGAQFHITVMANNNVACPATQLSDSEKSLRAILDVTKVGGFIAEITTMVARRMQRTD